MSDTTNSHLSAAPPLTSADVPNRAGVSPETPTQVEKSGSAEQLARRLEAAVRAAHVGIWTSTIGADHGEWNATMYELFDMVGAGRPPVLGEWLENCVHPHDAARVMQSVRDYLRGESKVFEIDIRILLRDGSTRWIMLRADIDRGSADRTRVFGIAMDVTERHVALAALHAASERAALIARHAGIGTWESDESDGAAQWDEQMFRLRGLEPGAQALGPEERLALVHPDDRARLIEADSVALAASQPVAREFRVRLPDGSYRWLASRSVALRDDHGVVVRKVGVNWDLTEGKNADLARQQAALAERESSAKSQFLTHMSHELRTPLNAVLGFTQLLQAQAQESGASDQLAKLNHIHAAGESLLALVNDSLDLARLEAGTLQLDLQPVLLAAAVAQVLPLVEEAAAAQRVLVQFGRLEGTARADPTRLQQVLMNLLTHAIKHTRPGGSVGIESRVDGNRVSLSMRDTGRNLPPEQLPLLFEPFQQIGEDDDDPKGTGIGLTIARALNEGMGGRIKVSSQPGQGTKFEVLLPASPSPNVTPAPALQPGVGAAPSPRRERSGQLLYIEDNSVNVLLVEELVKSLTGLRIASEGTGAAGVERARSLRPDVILIDMQLPDFDGVEVLRRLRAQPETANTRCIALSANAMPEDIAKGLARGFDDYWTKPIKFKPFLEALEQLFPVVDAHE